MSGECEHKFQFGDILRFNGIGNCDNCASPHSLDNVLIKYIGDYEHGHLFEVLTLFSCPGCHKLIDRYNVACGGLNVTSEYANAKAKSIKE